MLRVPSHTAAISASPLATSSTSLELLFPEIREQSIAQRDSVFSAPPVQWRRSEWVKEIEKSLR